MQKRGELSRLAVNLLIGSLIIILGVVIFFIFRGYIEDNEQKVFSDENIDLKISQVKTVDDNTLDLTLKRSTGEGEFVGLSFAVSDGSLTEVIRINSSMPENQEGNFSLDFILINASKIKTISVTPIYLNEEGLEVIGNVKDEYVTPNTCSNYCPTGAQCGFNGCGMQCGNGCSKGYLCLNYKCIKEKTSSGGGGGSSGGSSGGNDDDDNNNEVPCTDTCESLIKQCGTHSICGVNIDCGNCSEGYNCQTNGTCMKIPCTDTCDSLNYNCETHSICGVNVDCGNCSSGYYCNSGNCTACTTHASSNCSNGDVYWWNSCGQREGIRYDCNSTQTCVIDQCINNGCTNDTGCTSVGLTQCSGSLIQTCGNWDTSDSCFEWNTPAACPSGQTCVGNVCTGGSTLTGVEILYTSGGTEVILPKTGITAAELAVIINDNDPLSVQIGNYYVTARGIPSTNVIHISMPTGVRYMNGPSFNLLKQQQIDSALQGRNDIQAIAITWVEPFATDHDGSSDFSITSAISFGWKNTGTGSGNCDNINVTSGTTNPYVNNYNSVSPWTDLNFRPTMMIAAMNFTEAKALIDRGIASDKTFPSGTAYMLKTGDTRAARCTYVNGIEGSGYQCQWVANNFNYTNTGITPSILTVTSISNKNDVMFEFTGLAIVPNLFTNTYKPGAITDSLTSCAGMITNAMSGCGQMSAIEWLRAGSTASSGTITEPCSVLNKFSNITISVPNYFRGNTIIEAYWKSVTWPAETNFIGEPLAKPYGHRVYENGEVLTIETTWLKPGNTYVLEAADSESGPFTTVQSGISVSSYQIKNITVSSTLRNVYRLRVS